jgi:hypothetical protein
MRGGGVNVTVGSEVAVGGAGVALGVRVAVGGGGVTVGGESANAPHEDREMAITRVRTVIRYVILSTGIIQDLPAEFDQNPD